MNFFTRLLNSLLYYASLDPIALMYQNYSHQQRGSTVVQHTGHQQPLVRS